MECHKFLFVVAQESFSTNTAIHGFLGGGYLSGAPILICLIWTCDQNGLKPQSRNGLVSQGSLYKKIYIVEVFYFRFKILLAIDFALLHNPWKSNNPFFRLVSEPQLYLVGV